LTRDLPLARSHHHATYAVYPPASPHGVFWRSFTKLPVQQQNPFDSRLGAHKIQKLSARYGRVVYAAEIEANLPVVFYMDGNTVVTIDIGSHDLYR
jgi:hypothetical protein